MSTVDSAGVQFWDGTKWITLAKGAKGPVGPAGPTGTSVAPVKSLTSRTLTIVGSPTSVPSGWSQLTNLNTRADEVNPPVTPSGNSYAFVNQSPAAYMVSINFDFSAAVSTRVLLSLGRSRADGSSVEVARRTLGKAEGSLTLNAVWVQVYPTDTLTVSMYAASAVAVNYAVRLVVAPLGPIAANSQTVCHDDYTSAAARVASYTITPTTDAIWPSNGNWTGDWMYLVHMHYRETADIVPAPPAGWVQVVPPQVSGTAAGGIEWSVWRKKRAAGETGYTVNLSTARYVRASIITVRQPTDDMPVLSAFSTQRAAANPSVITVPGGVPTLSGGLVIAIAVSSPPAAITPPPSSVTGAVYWFSVPGTASTNYFAIATKTYPGPQNGSDPVVFSWTLADQAWIGGVALNFPGVTLSGKVWSQLTGPWSSLVGPWSGL